MSLRERVEAFKTAFARWPASWPWLVQERGEDVLYAVWVIGNDYRNKTRYYGAYPAGFLDRVMALFPDRVAEAEVGGFLTTLHVFSGSLPPGPYLRCDVTQPAEFTCSVYDLPAQPARFDLVIADPPYSKTDAQRYGTPMIDRRRVLAALADVTNLGGHLAWLDTCWPMHRKAQWRTAGRILVQRSTNHRARVLTLFERRAA
jgi:hypothetical protein